MPLNLTAFEITDVDDALIAAAAVGYTQAFDQQDGDRLIWRRVIPGFIDTLVLELRGWAPSVATRHSNRLLRSWFPPGSEPPPPTRAADGTVAEVVCAALSWPPDGDE